MKKFLKKWLYYGLGREEYKNCLDKVFINNLYSLRKANIAVAVMGLCFSMFPLLVERNIFKASFHIGLILIAVILFVIVKYKEIQHKKGKQVSSRFIYIMIIAYYINVITFGINLGVFLSSGTLAVTFMGILIVALFLFVTPPLLNLCLTIGALALFMTATISVKSPQDWSLDVTNSLFAGSISIFFGWFIVKFRLSLAWTANKLEVERNSYYDQSTVDDLTQLKNRRDFMQAFQRFLSNYRQTDNFLCIAVLDVDYFKNYNDYYGHAKGDDCLRSIGKMLNTLHENNGIYTARVGGEEFGLIWFEKKSANANKIASQINMMMRKLNIPHEKSKAAPYLTVSIGIHITQCGVYNDINVLYDLADKALYSAKHNGRNCAIITSSCYIPTSV